MRRVCSVFALFTLAAGCDRPPAARPEAPPAPVMVAPAATRTVPVQFKGIGTVRPVSTVSIRPRVGGELTAVLFKEGDFVKKGQPLFTIDPRPYDAAVKQAEANRAKNLAVLAGAERELRRVERLNQGVAVAAVELDSARTAAESAKAAVAADDAAINTAKIQLSFTNITSPLDGRAGGLLVTAGNLVSANEPSPLVVINQVSPIHVSFALPEQRLPAVNAARRDRPLKVEAFVRESEPPVVGELAFVDNTVDAGTGSVTLKAEFANTDLKLWPGQFIDTVLTLGDRTNSVVVPSSALQTGQQGAYVYIITPEKKAELRKVTVAFELPGEVVIASGLSGGESVVVEGQLRLAPGAAVEVKASAGRRAEGVK